MTYKPDPLLVLSRRAEACAQLYESSDMTLEDALAPLLEYAQRTGLIRDLGEEAITAVIRHPFIERLRVIEVRVDEDGEWNAMWAKPFERPEKS